ncbi:ATP-binding protein [Pseudoalteromonas sp. C2R02]|uniref:ATP-binding protein n=1 Tax=Pseudoalteromonas sp. C2R02 TaxID=2841565 RepID=UPI00339D9558
MRFMVADTGIGLSQRHMDKLFAQFVQADTSTTRQYGGIGLAICKRLVELMGGKIWIESELGQGSRFIFDLPFDISDLINSEEYVQQEVKMSIKGKKFFS